MPAPPQFPDERVAPTCQPALSYLSFIFKCQGKNARDLLEVTFLKLNDLKSYLLNKNA